MTTKLSDVPRLSDEWQTPQWLFDELNKEFKFDIDLCATKENSKCGRKYFNNYLNTDIAHFNSLAGNSLACCFMNPPYSSPKPFIQKAWDDSKYCKIVCLLPNTIKTCAYMDILDEYEGTYLFRKWKQGAEIRDLSRRTKFVHPTKSASSPSFGCMIIIMDRR